MKRLWILALALCMTALFCVGTLGLGAEDTNTDIWFVYSMKENDKGSPLFSLPPAYEYTSEGLRVTPHEKMESYTVQTDRAFCMDDGLYMEIKLDSPEKFGILVFHMWDQSGMMMSNYHCGSGWQCILQLDENTTQYTLSAFLRGVSSDNPDGSIKIFGSAKISAPVSQDGSVNYSLSVKDGGLYINDTAVSGSAEIMKSMREIRPDGTVHFGVTVNMTGQDEGIPLTVTRFGTSKKTATVPGQTGTLPETGSSSVETAAPDPTETDPPAEDVTTAPAPETKPSGGQDTAPSEPDRDTVPAEPGQDTLPPEPDDDTDPSAPTETETEYDPFGDPPDMTTEKYDPPFAEKETETRREIHDAAVDNLMGKLEGCASSLGMGLTGLVSVLAAAYVCTHKKDRNE